MIKCIAIDDEPLALKQIAGYIGKTPFLRLMASCRSALEAVEVLVEQDVELMFVDINMPDLNGLDFVKSLAVKPMVVFTTAYSEYALEGFRVDALDYLLKPIAYSDFLRSAEKAYRQVRLQGKAPVQSPAPEEGTIFVKSEYRTVRIDTQTIIRVESQSEYVRIYMDNEKPVMTLASLKSYEESLPKESFMRIHRSHIINLRRIKAVERKHAILGDGFRVPIGELYEESFREYLAKHTLD